MRSESDRNEHRDSLDAATPRPCPAGAAFKLPTASAEVTVTFAVVDRMTLSRLIPADFSERTTEWDAILRALGYVE